ncbi:MAG: ABC transporter ATP-binding protein [Planctomycetota bacterium]
MTLIAETLHVTLGNAEIIYGIDLRIDTGEMVAVVGPNGSGKSTLVRTVAGLLKPESGRILVDGRPIRSMSPRQRASQLGLLAQSAQPPSLTTVEEHIGLGCHSKRSILSRWTTADSDAVRDAMATCEVTHLATRRLENLSGGERQRVRLATLLAQDPGHLLLDEPLTGLDIEHQLGLLHLLQRLNTDRGRTVVCVLHDLDLALRFFERVVVIHQGHIAADGTPSEVLCPRIFESVFRVDGRVGCEVGGEPVIMCRQCRPASRTDPEKQPEPKLVELTVQSVTASAFVAANGPTEKELQR